MKIKILVDFNGNVEGQSIPFHKGQEVEINDGDATHFVRGHYAEMIKPQVKVVEKPEIEKPVKEYTKIRKG